MSATRTDRWQHLVEVSFRLEEQLARSTTREEREAAVRALLDSLLEVFPSGLDPLDDFEAYAVRRLAGALRNALTEA